MIQNQKSKIALLLAGGVLLGGVLPAAHADRIWWDGSRDTENAPPGKLLSDNEGYWGERIVTGVEYSYDTAPDSPSDWIGDDKTQFGRRLLNGVPAGDWHQPVGTANRPIVPIFDFKRVCTFSEVDISTRSQKAAVKIEVADKAEGPFRVVFERSRDDAPDKMFHRLVLPAKAIGRFLRLTVNAVEPKIGNYLTYLEEVVVWGDSAISDKSSEVIAPTAPTNVITGMTFSSIPGATGTTFSDSEFGKWKGNLGASSRLPAVWSPLSTWDNITDRPILPTAKQIGQVVPLTMARNETENAALALTNTNMINPASGSVTLSAFKRVGRGKKEDAAKIKGTLSIAGAIKPRGGGAVIGPLFSADNKLSESLMQRHLTNTETIKNFPRLTLTPAGSAVLWLAVTSAGAAPGIYEAQLNFRQSMGDVARRSDLFQSSVPVRVEVLDVSLPQPFVYLNTWDHATGMFPFVYGDRQAREVAHKLSLGQSVWHHLPTPGSEADTARKQLKGTGRKQMYHVRLVPYHYVNEGFNGRLKDYVFTDKDKQAIAQYLRDLVKQTQALGLGYDDWYGEMWDEPNKGSAEAYGVLARMVKEIDPKVNVYVNPIFWEGNGPSPDSVIAPMLSPWYRQLVDVSVPHEILLNGYPQSVPLFDAPRLVNATYRVSTHGAKSERSPVSYQAQGWDAFARGYNGWGFYSYFSPLGNPWDDADSYISDYVMVYPGPRGPVPSRTSEAVREGWEQYRLLSLLKTRGRKSDIDALLKAYKGGELPETLRVKALRAAAKR